MQVNKKVKWIIEGPQIREKPLLHEAESLFPMLVKPYRVCWAHLQDPSISEEEHHYWADKLKQVYKVSKK